MLKWSFDCTVFLFFLNNFENILSPLINMVLIFISADVIGETGLFFQRI